MSAFRALTADHHGQDLGEELAQGSRADEHRGLARDAADAGLRGHARALARGPRPGTSESMESESIRHFLTLYRVSKTLLDTIWST